MTEADAMTVEMLWEQDVPADVLESRFGFSSTDAAGIWVADTLEQRWGIRVEACERIVMSDQNALAWVNAASGPLLLKWSVAPQRFPRLAATARLTNWLASRGVPVSAHVPALSGDIQVEVGGVSLGLQRKIQGGMLDASNLEQIYTAGSSLARLHAALREYPDAERMPGAEVHSKALLERVSGWLSSPPAHIPNRPLEALRNLIDATLPNDGSVQLIHGDYRAANILCDGAEVVAILDFEETWIDHPIVELARSAVLIGTLFYNWGPVSDTVRNRFRAGYESERELTATEASWWDALVFWFSLLMVPAGDDPTGWLDEAMRQLSRLGEA